MQNLSPNKSRHLGFIFAITGTLLFSLKSIFIKFLYQQGLDANSVLVLRMGLALPIYIVILFFTLRHRPQNILSNKVISAVFLLGFLGYYLASLLDLMGLELITAQLERLTLFTYPFLVSILGFIFFKEAITRRTLFAFILSYIGLWIVMGQEIELTGNNVIYGVSLVLASALCFAIYVLFSRPLIKQLTSVIFTSMAMISSCLFGLIHGVIVIDWSLLIISDIAWLWLALLVIVSTVIPSFMMAEAIDRIGPTQTGIAGMIGPIFTIGFAVYFLSEPFTSGIALGVALVIFGVGSLMIRKSAH